MMLKYYSRFLKSKTIKKTFSSVNREIILMTGAPGVGKGTFSKLLSRDFKIPEFSTGEELRRIISSDDNKDPHI